ncbi:MAG TPA: carboxypeptidase regulatory-like domain-containing protein [Mucilaginibacter sp.]|jgi:hypothetical protein
MLKILYFFLILLPLGCFAQITITGRILNQADTKPVANASVFLSNATIGSKTANDGTFTLHNVKPGKYDIVVSIIGFETYDQIITVGNSNITLPDIAIFPKTIALKEVTVKYHVDPDRENYLNWFKNEFLGTSDIAKECKILNPEALDFSYDEDAHKLTASSYDYLQIENNALGYRIKYLITDFSLENKDAEEKKVYYKGPVLFEELKGSSSEEQRWLRNRLEVYENSSMHFLRAALSSRLTEEGFRVQGVIYANPERPPDSLINARIEFYKDLKPLNKIQDDSLSFWVKKSKLPKLLKKLQPSPLNKKDIIKDTGQPGQYALGYKNDALLVAYSSNHHFHMNNKFDYLYNPGNTENTLIKFNEPLAFFYSNGVIINPYSVIYYGVWGRNRVAGLLPIDYEAPQNSIQPQQENLSAHLDSAMEKYLAVHQAEKAYLQFDKPYYAAGDTIYFKAYVTKGEQHRLSDLSGVLHVDMINTAGKVDRSIKLQLDSGIAWGDFALPDTLPKGNYRVRAYTRWMRNEGDAGFFDKTIPVGSLKTAKIPESLVKQPVPATLKPDIQFFPEGGSLVAGIRSKVAFKAIGPNGLGIATKGTLVDNENNEVASFSSTHLGMGYFYLSPVGGKTYKAKISYPNGQKDTVSLPKPETNGLILSVNNDALQEAQVRIEANKEYYQINRNKDYTLVIYSGGTITTVNCKLDSPVIKFDILKRKLRTGIAAVTIFSSNNEPLCERLLFIQNYDQLNVNISSNKNSYARREKVDIRLNALDRKGATGEGHFSAAVVNESVVPENETNGDNILSYLLLSSDLKGYIEHPNYYFSDTSETAREDLDVLMLTQGYRRFAWQQVLDSTTQARSYQPEKGIEIAGQLKNMFNNLVMNGTTTLIPSKGGPVLSSTTDDKGMFHFSNLVFTDTAHFVLSAVNAKNKNSTKITYFNDEKDWPAVQPNQRQAVKQVTDTAMNAFVENDKLQEREVLNFGNGKGIMLKEVKIKDKKPDDQYRTQSLAGAGHADQVVHSAELGYGPLISKLNGLLRGVTFVRDTPYLTLSLMDAMGKNPPHKMLVILDGVENGDFGGLQTTDVETVEVLRYASTAIYGMEGGGGVLIITTARSRRLDPKDIASIGILPIAPVGFYKAREFYSPKYDNTTLVGKQRDFRSTIYWKPELVTDKDGNASFDYFNADGTGTYKVVIEGVDNNGNIGRQVYRYKVE